MKKLVYNPVQFGARMTIVCFISGSGTNYRQIVVRNPDHHYLVFTNRPGCSGTEIARNNQHQVIELSQVPYLKEAKKKYGPGQVPRNCPERIKFEQDVDRLILNKLGREPDLICLAGYDQWLTDWTVKKYYPRILNVHPGDTTQGYEGLHWVPAAKAILARDNSLRSTLFFVDQGEDTGPVLVQSEPMNISDTLIVMEGRVGQGLTEELKQILDFARSQLIRTYEDFCVKASPDLQSKLEQVSSSLQEALKVAGDWKIYPLAVHDLIARGRVEVDDRQVYVDGQLQPVYGYRPDEHRC
jgi:folate-dependent phosphoribosylglycinamide formyltransferase PurN